MDRDNLEELIKNNKYYECHQDMFEPVMGIVLKKIGGLEKSITDESLMDNFLKRVVTKSFQELLYKTPKASNNFNCKFIQDIAQIPTAKKNVSFGVLKRIYQYIHERESDEITVLEKIFDLKYRRGFSLNKISDELNLTEKEVVDKIFEIVSLTNRMATNELSKM